MVLVSDRILGYKPDSNQTNAENYRHIDVDNEVIVIVIDLMVVLVFVASKKVVQENLVDLNSDLFLIGNEVNDDYTVLVEVLHVVNEMVDSVFIITHFVLVNLVVEKRFVIMPVVINCLRELLSLIVRNDVNLIIVVTIVPIEVISHLIIEGSHDELV